MKLLLVEDEAHLCEALCQILKNNGYEVDFANDGKSGLNKALLEQYDMLLLDIMLPQLDGLELLRRVREAKIDTPTILLTARGEVSDKIQGLDYGADDYIQKPFNSDELLARIRAHIRRVNPSSEPTYMEYGDVKLIKSEAKLVGEQASVALSYKEVELFEYFIQHSTIVIPFNKVAKKLSIEREEEQVSRTGEYVEILKNKLHHVKSNATILTIQGVGYKLITPTEKGLWRKPC